MSRMSHIFDLTTVPGEALMVIGPKGSRKTTTGLATIDVVMNLYSKATVFTNMVMHRFLGYNQKGEQIFSDREMPKNWVYVNSMSGLMLEVGKAMQEWMDGDNILNDLRMIVLIDEGYISDFGPQHWLHAKGPMSLLQLFRKFRLGMVIISMEREDLTRKARSGSMIRFFIDKGPETIIEWLRENNKRIDPSTDLKSLGLFQMPEYKTVEDILFTVPVTEHNIPEYMLKAEDRGRIVFDTLSTASFKRGSVGDYGEKWIEPFIDFISEVDSRKVPAKIKEFFEGVNSNIRIPRPDEVVENIEPLATLPKDDSTRARARAAFNEYQESKIRLGDAEHRTWEDIFASIGIKRAQGYNLKKKWKGGEL